MKAFSIIAASLLLGASTLSLAEEAAVAQATPELKSSDFQKLDKNKDGQLDSAEALDNGIQRSTFQAMDSDGDNKVSEKEFMAAIKGSESPSGNS